MLIQRRTLSESVSISGLGLHSGIPVTVTVHPGKDGIAFRHGADRFPATPDNVTDTTRCTKLGTIAMIEHLMSRLAAMQITDAEIEVSSPELPALDGSAAEYLTALKAVPSTPVGERTVKDPFGRLFLQKDGGLKMAVSKGSGHWRYVYDRGDVFPGHQAFETLAIVDDYSAEIAPARTLVLTKEIELARQAGLGKGLTEESVLIIGDTGYDNPSRFPDEPARHKLLDLVGDLYLSGVPICLLNVVAERTGHRDNVEMASMLYRAVSGSRE